MTDSLTAELDRIAERHEHMRTRYGNVGGLLALAGAKDDMPRALAALKAVLEVHQGVTDGDYPENLAICDEDGEFYPCPTVRAITAALAGTGKEAGDGS